MKIYEEQIEEIMDEFDFEQVHKVMKFLDWRWLEDVNSEGGVPSISDLRKSSRKLLKEASGMKNVKISTGGFLAENNGNYLTLRFVLSEWYVEPEL
jgi:hypothetical protein